MRKKIFLRPWIVGLYWVLFLTPGLVAIGKEFSEEEMLSVLPAGSVIASIRPRLHEDGGKTARKRAIMQVRLSNQEDIETIVGYYTEPDREGKEQTATYYSRVHVALLARKNNAIKVLWDSGGWGFDFGMRRTEDTYTDTQLSLFLGLRDLNDNGRDELVFCRTSFGAEGSQFEIWQYDSQKEKMIQICETAGSIEIVESPSNKWPVIRATSFHASTIRTMLFEYDSDLRCYKASKAELDRQTMELEK
ncbi:MAG: hypothetical protein L6437_00555 [Kiritimatiellae bacterium]|nr:hypothetical protein [Verrucomicrobiota bacterium]MBU4365765.1 hypothetical protein [Verrucomicrobiota bacterium]MCG2658721.1 hypothetical protein [Kiritimatiellia bacterium]